MILQPEMPLLIIGGAQLGTERIELRIVGIGERICGIPVRQNVKIGNRAILLRRIGRGVKAIRLLERFLQIKGRVESWTWIRERSVLLSPVEDAITRSHDQVVCEPVRKAYPRRKIIPIRADQASRRIALDGKMACEERRQRRVLALGHHQGKGVEVESCQLVVVFFDGAEEFIAQTKI